MDSLAFKKSFTRAEGPTVRRNTHFPGVPLMALTATATDKVAADIIKCLAIPTCHHFLVRK